MCFRDLMERYNSYNKSGQTYLHRTISGNLWLVWLYVFLFCIGSFILLPIEINATATYYQNNELYLTGTLIYRGSSTGYDPVDNLNGRKLIIYLNGEAERCLAIEPYLTNMCTQNVEGWVSAGYKCSIPYSDQLHVNQLLHTNTSTRNGTAYYDVEVEDIQTNLLFRPERNNTYITLIVCGLILLSFWCVIKGVRHD